MTRPSKQQIAAVRAALRECDAELLAWDPHIFVSFEGQRQKAQIIARISQLGWHYVNDPKNETDDVSIVEFSLDAPSSPATVTSAPRNGAQRVRFPAPFFASFAILAAIVGVIMAASGLYTDHRMGLLERMGTRTTGRVANTYSKSSRGSRIQYVLYRFVDTQGISHESEDVYPFDDWDTLHQGDPISVTYLADHPERNNLTERIRLITGRSAQREVGMLAVPWMVAGGFFLGYLVRRRRA